jgi:hypothetical protein
MTEIWFYRDVRHPDMLFEIRLALEDAGLDVRLTETVAGLMEGYGWQIPQAIHCVRVATTWVADSPGATE